MTISEIRRAVFKRQKRKCLWCDRDVTWEGCHLHEKKFRSQGGEISLENSIILCPYCHLNWAHGDRKLRFKKPLDRRQDGMIDSKSQQEDK
jgi:5-methylcytosine-specific restriction endonuclease McrA